MQPLNVVQINSAEIRKRAKNSGEGFKRSCDAALQVEGVHQGEQYGEETGRIFGESEFTG